MSSWTNIALQVNGLLGDPIGWHIFYRGFYIKNVKTCGWYDLYNGIEYFGKLKTCFRSDINGWPDITRILSTQGKMITITTYNIDRKQDFADVKLEIVERMVPAVRGEICTKENIIISCRYDDCSYENFSNTEYCIFHLKDDNKNVEEFNRCINKILETEEDINFNGFYFPHDTDFSRKHFKHLNFKNAKFLGDVNFDNAEFSGYVNFENVEFSGNASFINTKYILADFRGAKFSKYANFISVECSGYMDFQRVKFLGNVTVARWKFFICTFEAAEFSKDANFYFGECSGYMDFQRVKFLGNMIFHSVECSGYIDFREARFLGAATFEESIDAGKDDFCIIKFQHVFFSDDVRIRMNLSKCYFYGCNIERVDLTDSKWFKRKDLQTINIISKIIIFFLKSSIIIFEECEECQFATSKWKDIENIYRRLKQSYQRFGDYSSAGEFYFQEMECKRKQLGIFRRQFWNIFYRGFCGYGEKPFNVVLVSIFIIVGFATIYFYSGILVLGKTVNYDITYDSFNLLWIKDFLWSLYLSVDAFTTFGVGDVQPIGWSRLFASIEAWLGVFMASLFIFVFTRKMLL